MPPLESARMVEQKRVPPDREIIKRFVEHLRNLGQPDLKIDSWPEDDHPGQSVVEAIAGNLAIEHTSVDTLPDQRRIGEQFMDALGILDHLPAASRLSINVPYELVTVGTDWEAYRLALAHWILSVAPTLPDGRYDIELPNTPLTCIGIKESDRPARVVISRPIQDDETLSQRVAQQITRKMKKLRRYKADGYATVLILETHGGGLRPREWSLSLRYRVRRRGDSPRSSRQAKASSESS
jgi:hypothetical protein